MPMPDNIEPTIQPTEMRGIIVKHLGLVNYVSTYAAMQSFTALRDSLTHDEIWSLQHPPVYTLGLSVKPRHLPREENGIPLVKTDRGGQITYHGPGQLVVYTLLDLYRLGLSIRDLVRRLEAAVIDLLAEYSVVASGNPKAPGVYIEGAKIAALGLRVKRNCCYHGLALNVDMDLDPFSAIDPCGHPGMKVIQTRDFGIPSNIELLSQGLITHLVNRLTVTSRS